MRLFRRTAPAYAVASFVLLTSCSGSSATPVQIGIKRTAVDLAFKDDALPPKLPEVRVVYTDLPQVEAVVLPEEPLAPRQPSRVGPPVELCPKAPVDAVPEQAVSIAITKPPTEGRYVWQTKGSIKISSAIFNISLPMPPLLRREVQNVKQVPIKDSFGADTAVKAWQYDLVLTLGSTTYTSTYQLRAAAIVLMQQSVKSATGTRTFKPHAPMSFYEFGAENRSWRSAGLDTSTNTAALYEGRVAKRELVDVCGKIIDTYMATLSEVYQTTGGYQSQTQQDDVTTRDKNEADPNRFSYATHIGPLPVKEHIHYTEIVAIVTPQGQAAQATIEYNYDTTIMSLEPGFRASSS